MTGPTPDETRAMRRIIREALDASTEPGKAGISAALLRDGEVIASGSNHVHLQTDPTRHAEIVALGRAASRLGRPDLSDCTLLSTLQPCEMCLAAARFAGIGRVVFAARKSRVAAKYFAFGHLELADFQGDPPQFDCLGGCMEDEVLHLYADGRE
ncbi:nucleoside deaminase [Mangrovicoccus algicola]|uniref:Nucleoside deaminase n=1 Tax=Mangrovicoccus algicola TaxID=2771008 RepID=A0A8J7CZ19_9RHOB|nr:nucleoside deaminase [Mangrovicoccus algicola]MBE3640287.1 nucleoside deaminase [Mangrovicoccus algicola]